MSPRAYKTYLKFGVAYNRFWKRFWGHSSGAMTLLGAPMICALAGAGCASVGTLLPRAAPEQEEREREAQLSAALDHYVTLNTRLQRVASTVLTANAPLCPSTQDDFGLHLLTLKDIPKPLRKTASARFGLSDDAPRVFYSADARLALGDEVFDGEGEALRPRGKGPRGPLYTQDGTALDMPSKPRCGYPVTLDYSPAVNAYATGRAIKVTTGMMEFTDDKALALIIGHELAHNTQGHVAKIVTNTVLGLGSGRFARQFESEADYVGLYYAARAGIDISEAAQLWRRMGLRSVKSVGKASSHPSSAQRYVDMEAAIAEIKSKQDAGAPLLPNRLKAQK